MSFYGEEFRDDVVGIYMKDLKKAPTVEEEKEYLKEIKSGNEDAKKEFIERNLRLVVSIAKEYVGQGIEFPDLIQEGNMGLVKALNYFNPDLGYKFSTYATWWIKQGMTRTIDNDSDQIRKPVHMKEKMKKMMTVEAKLRNKLDREPTLEEVAFEMDMPLEKAAEIRKLRTQMISLDSLITPNKDDDYDRNKSKVKDFVENRDGSPEEELSNQELKKLIQKFMKKAGLTEREIRVLLLRNGFKENKIYTLEEIGSQESVTRERIRQIEKKALDKLRNSKYRKMFTDYVPEKDLNFVPKEKRV